MPESVKRRGSSGPTMGAMVGLSGRVATSLNNRDLRLSDRRLRQRPESRPTYGKLARTVRSPTPKGRAMSVTDELLQNNESYASGFSKGDLAMPPAKHTTVITCMDARLVPSRQLGLAEGDAHVIRNAGGRAQDALRSLVVSQRLLGTNEVMVIHHSDCGMRGLTDDAVRSAVREDLGA